MMNHNKSILKNSTRYEKVPNRLNKNVTKALELDQGGNEPVGSSQTPH